MTRALVIGGGRGIGAAVVAALAASGHDVAFTYRTDAAQADTQLAALRTDHPNASFDAYALDLSDRDAVEAFATVQEDAQIGVLVHAGGSTYDILAAVMDQDRAERLMQVNFWSFTRLARAVVRPMTRARFGRIVAISSVLGQASSPGNAAYAASKAAMLAYVRTLAIESARRGVTVNAVAPGFVDTEMMAPFAAHRAANEARIPAGRYAAATEIGAVVAFLASPAAAYVTGALIPVDGGLSASLGVARA
jgi:3-oxoacyl-[acyl-carrier protein] reductase